MGFFIDLICLLVGQQFAEPKDVIVLNSGQVLEGRIVREDWERVLLHTNGKERWIARLQIEELDAINQKLQRYLHVSNNIKPQETQKRIVLAQTLAKSNLAREAHLEAWLVLQAEPNNHAAHTLLGHKQRGQNEWLAVDKDNQFIPFHELLNKRKTWNSCWEIETEHFGLRSNLDIYALARLAKDLEVFYAAVYSELQALQLQECLQPISIYIYASPEQAQELDLQRKGYFNYAENRIYVSYLNGKRTSAVFHEVVHAILYQAVYKQGGGSIAPWIDEGVAEYCSSWVTGQEGYIKINTAELWVHYFQTIKNSSTVFRLADVINFNRADFADPNKRDLLYAYSYSLVHFLLHGQGQEYRNGFMEFMQASFRGPNSEKLLNKYLAASTKEIEQGWRMNLGK